MKNRLTLAALTAAALLLTACRTTKTTEREERLTLDRLERIDSLLHLRMVTETDSAWREQVLRQAERISERRDTTHTLTVDTAGNVLKETLIIRERTERESETYERTLERLTHRLEAMDSTLAAQTRTIAHLDSLAHREQQVKEVPAPLTWWQRARMYLGTITLYALVLAAGFWVIKKKLLR